MANEQKCEFKLMLSNFTNLTSTISIKVYTISANNQLFGLREIQAHSIELMQNFYLLSLTGLI